MADVIIYHFALDDAQLLREEASRYLSPDERARADRFVFARDRDRFIAGRAGLRRVLAAYCDAAPADLGFRYGPHGRPYLDQPTSCIHFNLSHSQGVAVLAVSRSSEVGIDLEVAMPFDQHYRELAGHVLTAAEQEDVHDAPATERARVFLEYWTAKEAFLKLGGDGLNVAPRTIEVDRRHARVSRPGQVGAIVPLMLGKGIVATLAAPHAVGVKLEPNLPVGRDGPDAGQS